MGIGIIGVNHVNVTVPAAQEANARHFYGVVLGLPQIPKPEGPRQSIGAWYQINGAQLHLSIEDDVQNDASDRHICYQVADLHVAMGQLREAGINITPDRDHPRFFVRDPGGNLIEITHKP